jgi:osmotically-inducible protein OsmY
LLRYRAYGSCSDFPAKAPPMMTLTPPQSPSACASSIDEDLSRRIRLFLATLHLAGLKRIHIEVEEGLVTIGGIVRSYYERQLAVACVRRVAGVRQIVDRIRVTEGE